MSLGTTEQRLVELCTLLVSDENLQVSVKESLKGGAIAGVCTVIGGVVGGPVGLAFGGSVGGCVAAYLARDKFLPLSQVIERMPPEQQKALAAGVRELVVNLKAEDATMLVALVAGDAMLKQQLLRKIVQTVENQANVRVANFEW